MVMCFSSCCCCCRRRRRRRRWRRGIGPVGLTGTVRRSVFLTVRVAADCCCRSVLRLSVCQPVSQSVIRLVACSLARSLACSVGQSVSQSDCASSILSASCREEETTAYGQMDGLRRQTTSLLGKRVGRQTGGGRAGSP